MTLPRSATPTRAGQSVLSYATQAALLTATAREGAMAYAQDTNAFYFRSGSSWLRMGYGDTLVYTPNMAHLPSSNPAALSSRNEHPILAFDHTTPEFAIFTGNVPFGYSGGSIGIYFEWASTATSGNVVWGVEFERRLHTTGHDIDSDSFATQQTVTTAVVATEGIPSRSGFTLTQAQCDAIASLDSFRLRLSRVADNAADTVDADDAQFLGMALVF